MYVVIYEPSSGEVVYQRALGDEELMDERKFADEYAASIDMQIDESDGYIPNCCGDIRVEFRQDPENAVIIWSGQSFYFKESE